MKFLNIVKRKNKRIQMLEREIERLECTNEALREQWTESTNILLQNNKWLGIGQRIIYVFSRHNGRMIFVDERAMDIETAFPSNKIKRYRTARPINSCKTKPKMFKPEHQPFQTSDGWNPVWLYKHRIKLKK